MQAGQGHKNIVSLEKRAAPYHEVWAEKKRVDLKIHPLSGSACRFSRDRKPCLLW